MPLLEREEYIEQAYFFRTLAERMRQNVATQDLLAGIREEILSTTRLPLAIDYMAAELRLIGMMSPAMAKLAHYFAPFQAFVMGEAESERGRFDFYVALEVLHREALYRAENPTPQGIFLFQFETLCRNRLGYDRGLAAMAKDPMFNEDWSEWILTVRRQVGIIDFADLLYVRSAHYQRERARREGGAVEPERPVLFGEKEGKIAFANRYKDPLLLFAALARQLGYPTVARPVAVDEARHTIPSLLRRMERLEARIKLMEEEQKKGGIDLNKFYSPPTFDDDQPLP